MYVTVENMNVKDRNLIHEKIREDTLTVTTLITPVT